MARLSEQERQEIVRYIEADRPLPEKYRFLLFADKREVELGRETQSIPRRKSPLATQPKNPKPS